MGRKARIANLEARITAIEALLSMRDWGQLPPPYDIPVVDLPTMPDYTTGVILDDDDWHAGYV